METQRLAWSRRSPARNWLGFSVITAGSVIVWVVTWLAIAGTVGLGAWALSLVIPSACVILFALIVLRQERTWISPVRKMNRMLPQIRIGELPIESLSEIDGGLKDLAGQVKLILHDLRQQKAMIAELEAEMQQRVANRTNALERKIGSLRQQATRDALTGLFNRRMLDQYLPEAIAKCIDEKTSLALLMIDVDHFKLLNDAMGHLAGDELLRDIGQIIRSTIREQDAGFRCGGDEFVVVLPGCNQHNAEELGARLNSLVMALTRTFRVRTRPKLSVGVATLDDLSETTSEALLDAADKRLYQIKSARNSLCPATGDTDSTRLAKAG